VTQNHWSQWASEEDWLRAQSDLLLYGDRFVEEDEDGKLHTLVRGPGTLRRLDENGEPIGEAIPFRVGELVVRYDTAPIVESMRRINTGMTAFTMRTKITQQAMIKLMRALHLPMRLFIGPVPAKAAHKRRYQKRH